MASPADQQRGDLGSVEHRASADRQPDAGAEKEPAEDRRQQPIGRDVWKWNDREHHRQAANGRRRCERRTHSPICRYPRAMNGRLTTTIQIDSGVPRHRRNQHRNAGDPAVDEVAGEKKAVDPHAGGEDPQARSGDAFKRFTRDAIHRAILRRPRPCYAACFSIRARSEASSAPISRSSCSVVFAAFPPRP